jgi:hypothetical protein
MPKYFALLLPALYAILGGITWYMYGSGPIAVVLWLVVQFMLIFIYRWLIADLSLGLMLKFHLISTGIGMLILFYVLIPSLKPPNGQLVLELVLMVFGTFCCAVGLFSLLYMIIRKLVWDKRKAMAE